MSKKCYDTETLFVQLTNQKKTAKKVTEKLKLILNISITYKSKMV